MNQLRIASFVLVAVVALVLGLLAAREHEPMQQTASGAQRPDWELVDAQGQLRRAAEFDGQWVMVNFWATWCPPCLEEIPLLIQTQDRYADQDLQILGPAMDRLEPAQAYATKVGMNYPVLFGERGVSDWMTNLGDTQGALPWTVLINPEGKIVRSHAGALTPAILADWLAPLDG
nr:TlpA family protein disulfide reductase [Oceanococcus sp. HetDA_MAG_MS8]